MDTDVYTCVCGQEYTTEEIQCSIDKVCLTCRKAIDSPIADTMPLIGVEPEPGNWQN